MGRKQIVLLGIGHTNAHVVKQWESEPIPSCDLICVSNFPEATYSGMLPGTLGKQFDRDAMRIELQRLVEKAGAELILGETETLDLESRQIRVAGHGDVPFDLMSIGVGSVPAGYEDYRDDSQVVAIKPMQTFIKRLQAAMLNAESVIRSEENSSPRPMQIVIVGGGVAGVEIAFCLSQRLQLDERSASIVMVSSSERIAGSLNDRSVSRLESMLDQRGIQVHRSERVVDATSGYVLTETQKRIDADVVIWATGAAAPSVISLLGLETDASGFIATHPTLQTLSDPRIFAVGDSGTILQSPCPKAGVYAVRQAPILWHNLQASVREQPLKRFQPQGQFLKLLNTGDQKALLDYHWFSFHSRWCLKLKNHIDHGFIRQYQSE
ncbi:FAD-dependent oxidoreductase [Stieleria sp. JC731]|uniref:FAD-dependent oxidoreductase n=1 Tax=Pirellulaceae TaxID=2691357 RepID=UPI001E5BCD0F|nr:FAD-dependent oxidoreductase [Stieleria sp. JC731]MCC9602998.1 FAD-dependent oxidoreductase [Stieleria sp. JC731]